MSKKFQDAAIATIIAVIIVADSMLLGFVSVPESPTYSNWIKAIVFLAVYGITIFVVLILLKFRFGK